MLGEQIWTCIQEDGERKETGNAWKKRTKTDMLLQRRICWLCRTSCLEVRWEQTVRGIGSDMETGHVLLEIGWMGKEKLCNMKKT